MDPSVFLIPKNILHKAFIREQLTKDIPVETRDTSQDNTQVVANIVSDYFNDNRPKYYSLKVLNAVMKWSPEYIKNIPEVLLNTKLSSTIMKQCVINIKVDTNFATKIPTLKLNHVENIGLKIKIMLTMTNHGIDFTKDKSSGFDTVKDENTAKTAINFLIELFILFKNNYSIHKEILIPNVVEQSLLEKGNFEIDDFFTIIFSRTFDICQFINIISLFVDGSTITTDQFRKMFCFFCRYILLYHPKCHLLSLCNLNPDNYRFISDCVQLRFVYKPSVIMMKNMSTNISSLLNLYNLKTANADSENEISVKKIFFSDDMKLNQTEWEQKVISGLFTNIANINENQTLRNVDDLLAVLHIYLNRCYNVKNMLFYITIIKAFKLAILHFMTRSTPIQDNIRNNKRINEDINEDNTDDAKVLKRTKVSDKKALYQDFDVLKFKDYKTVKDLIAHLLSPIKDINMLVPLYSKMCELDNHKVDQNNHKVEQNNQEDFSSGLQSSSQIMQDKKLPKVELKEKEFRNILESYPFIGFKRQDPYIIKEDPLRRFQLLVTLPNQSYDNVNWPIYRRLIYLRNTYAEDNIKRNIIYLLSIFSGVDESKIKYAKVWNHKQNFLAETCYAMMVEYNNNSIPPNQCSLLSDVITSCIKYLQYQVKTYKKGQIDIILENHMKNLEILNSKDKKDADETELLSLFYNFSDKVYKFMDTRRRKDIDYNNIDFSPDIFKDFIKGDSNPLTVLPLITFKIKNGVVGGKFSDTNFDQKINRILTVSKLFDIKRSGEKEDIDIKNLNYLKMIFLESLMFENYQRPTIVSSALFIAFSIITMPEAFAHQKNDFIQLSSIILYNTLIKDWKKDHKLNSIINVKEDSCILFSDVYDDTNPNNIKLLTVCTEPQEPPNETNNKPIYFRVSKLALNIFFTRSEIEKLNIIPAPNEYQTSEERINTWTIPRFFN
jgi:hypothetical protein